MSNCIFISAVDPDPTHPSTTVYNPQLLIGVGGGLGGGGGTDHLRVDNPAASKIFWSQSCFLSYPLVAYKGKVSK